MRLVAFIECADVESKLKEYSMAENKTTQDGIDPRATIASEESSTEQPKHYPTSKSAPDSFERLSNPSLDHARSAAPISETENSSAVRIDRRSEISGGMPAILTALKFAWNEMGALRSSRTLRKLNQKNGFDCPGCAWPDPDGKRAIAEFCENGVKAVAEEATVERVTPEFFREWSIEALSRQSDYWLGKQGRLTHPMVLKEGATNYEPLSWDQAFRMLAGELNNLSSPDEAIFYTSGRTSNEAAFLYQLFARQFGTNNLPDCSNMCHESSGTALTETIGVGKGTVTLEDFDLADTIFIVGQNPGTNHPRMLTSLLHAKRRGCTIVHVNPLPEAGLQHFKHPQEIFSTVFGKGTQLSDLFLQVRINGDVALFQGIAKEMLERESVTRGSALNHEFIREFTSGFDEYKNSLVQVEWADIVQESGVSRSLIREAADVVMMSQRTIFCWAMGLTQHKNAVANIQEIVNLLLMRGQIGIPGAGVCPVRGHSNVQGDRTMGIWERPTETFLNSLSAEFGFEPPRHHGFDTVESIKAMDRGDAKVFFALGGNFLSATPDTEFTSRAMRKCRLTAHVSTKLNRAHIVTGKQALILPCLGRTERDRQSSGLQFVTMENSMGVVHSSRGSLQPASEVLLSETAIVASLAQTTLGSISNVPWMEFRNNYDLIRDCISKVVAGFKDYNRRVRIPGGFYLPNNARDRKFVTDSGKANFTVHNLPKLDLANDQFLMMTIRSHDQFNTTIYGMDDRYRGIHNSRRVVFLCREDIRRLGFRDKQKVDLISHFEGSERVAHQFMIVPYSIPPRCAATYFPETNVLVPIGSVAEKSNTPASKSVIISIRPSALESL